jgi:hypothetical protein
MNESVFSLHSKIEFQFAAETLSESKRVKTKPVSLNGVVWFLLRVINLSATSKFWLLTYVVVPLTLRLPLIFTSESK